MIVICQERTNMIVFSDLDKLEFFFRTFMSVSQGNRDNGNSP